MKLKEKQLARKLRKKGWSINEICDKAGLAKSSVSDWVRDIELTPVQKRRLSAKGIRKEIIEKRRLTRLTRENARRQAIVDEAETEVRRLSKQKLFPVCVALYWAEGSKTFRGAVTFSNGDPEMIKLMMRFFREICQVPENKFRGYIHIHPHLNAKRAEKYWSSVSKIPLRQFYKTYRKPNKSSKNKRNSLPFGTFDINICNTELFLKILGWIKGLQKVL